MTTLIALLFLLLFSPTGDASAQGPVGIVVSNAIEGFDPAIDSAVVFDSSTDTVLGAVPIGPGSVGDCAISRDQTLGFVTDMANRLWIIDLTASPPALAPGTNPVIISSPGEDLSLSPDGKFVVVCDGSNVAPVSVVDIATRTEVDTFSLGQDCNSVDVCSDGSVLVSSTLTGTLRRLTIDAAGQLTDTGDALSFGSPINSYCAPGAASGVVLRQFPAEVSSFLIPGLNVVDARTLSSSSAMAGAFDPAGSRVFLRGNSPNLIDVFQYNTGTGALGASPFFTIPVSFAFTFFGIDQLAFNPTGTKLYVSEPNGSNPALSAVKVYDPSTGSLLGSVMDPSIFSPNGVCFPPATECGDGVLDFGEECDDGDPVDGDGCDSNCTTTACGNGIATGTEQCDDGNTAEGDGCDSNCTVSGCANGIVAGTEQCDDGNTNSCDGCSEACENEGFCGDAVLDPACEFCDGGGESATCDTDCTTATCGDGIVNSASGEVCDEFGESATCDSDCSAAACGDGTLNGTSGESCDGGGESTTCDVDCTAAACGDGTTNVTAGETCDDFGESATCDADCTAAACGDGTTNVTADETCDDGGESATCDVDCTAAVCGDGTTNVTAGETCDDGIESATCDADCTAAACGDGTTNVTAGETCDDGGESATCDVDCTAAVCGDGTTNVAAGETCDDGGQSATCYADCTATAATPAVLLSGKVLAIKDKATDATKRRFVVVSKDRSLQTPAVGSAGDPRANGAILTLFNPTTGKSETFALPAGSQFWKARGKKPEGKKGWRYFDKDFVNGPCKRVVVKPGRGLKAVCLAKKTPLAFSLDEPFQGEMAVTLQLGADAPFCMHFPPASVKPNRDFGTGVKRSGKGIFKAKNASAPTTCPGP